MTAHTSTPENDSSAVSQDEANTPSASAPSMTPGVAIGRGIEKLVRALRRFEKKLTGRFYAQYGMACTRIILGISGVGLLLSNFSARHYLYGTASAWNGELADRVSDFPHIWLFSLGDITSHNPALFTLYYLLVILIGIAVILGWRTRITFPLFFCGYISIIELNDALGDQSDNAFRIVMLFMLFASPHLKWSLDARRWRKKGKVRPCDEAAVGFWLPRLLHNLAIVIIAFQVCAIYMSGGFYKAGGVPWQNGWAIYDPLQTEQFGTWPVLSDLVTAWGPGVTIITWGTLILQIGFPFMLFNRYLRVIALFGILSFHIGIGILMGLPFFSLTMIAVDSIFITDRRYEQVSRILTQLFHGVRVGRKTQQQISS